MKVSFPMISEMNPTTNLARQKLDQQIPAGHRVYFSLYETSVLMCVSPPRVYYD